MPTPFQDLHDNSNASQSSYETAWSSSFCNRRSMNNSSTNVTQIKDDLESDMNDKISNLENDISMLSVSSAHGTPAKISMKKAPMTPGDRFLRNIEKEQDRALLKQLYPEMFEDPIEPSPQKKEEVMKKREPISDYENDDKENIPPDEKKLGKNIKEAEKQRSKRIVISSDSEDDEEFDNYLKKLRENPSKLPKPQRKEPKARNFIVDDDYISNEESETSEDEDDEEYRESSPELQTALASSDKNKKIRPADDEEWFLVSLSENFSGPVHEDAKVYVKENSLRYKKHRESLLSRLQDIFVRKIFSEISPEQLKVIWNPRLRKSAGQCRNHSNGSSTVEMSPVVCTTAERVRDTLIHELCHAAVWVVDKLFKEGHGPGWKRWGKRCSSAFKSLPFIERCHSYEIEAKFFYVCENDECGVEIKRQSKSLDTSRKGCGKCHGRFVLYRYCRRTNTRIRIEDPKANPVPKTTCTKPVRSSNSAAISEPPLYAPRRCDTKNPVGFKEYCEESYWKYTAKGMKHSDVMDKLLKEFNELNKT